RSASWPYADPAGDDPSAFTLSGERRTGGASPQAFGDFSTGSLTGAPVSDSAPGISPVAGRSGFVERSIGSPAAGWSVCGFFDLLTGRSACPGTVYPDS